MATSIWKRVQTQPIVLDIGQDLGALMVHTSAELHGREIEVSPLANAARRTHADVVERIVAGRSVWVAVFPALPAGEYSLWRDVMTDQVVTITGGAITEVNWREMTNADDFREARPEGFYSAGATKAPATAWFDVLPSQYRPGTEVSSAPMGSAPLAFSSDGEVAWDQMWGDFCELALAGGPKHRDSVLEPATPEAVAAHPDDYAHVVAELERGLRLVTALPCPPARPGWVGLRCDGESMAQWLLRAIAEENVSVRREGDVLYLPAAPTFRLDKEIKNVVTAVAKTHHYWQEHRDTSQRN